MAVFGMDTIVIVAICPETNREFWTNKIQHNFERDQRNYEECIKKGWQYLVIWQCRNKNI